MIDRQHNLSIAPNITTLSSGNELTRTHLVITTIHDGAKCSAVNLILDETRISPIRCVISTMHNLIRMSCGPSYILMPVHLPNAWYLQPKPLSLSLSLHHLLASAISHDGSTLHAHGHSFYLLNFDIGLFKKILLFELCTSDISLSTKLLI